MSFEPDRGTIMMKRNGVRFAGVCCLLLVVGSPLAAQPRSELPARDRMLRETATTVYAVGREEGAEHELFANVVAVGFDARDNLYVLDRDNQRVIVFDARGRFVRTVGKRGEGPGEFTFPIAMAVGADGSLLVADLGRASLSYFSPDGEYRSVPMPADAGRPVSGLLVRDAPDGALLRTQNIGPGALTTGQPPKSPIIRLAPLGDGARVTKLFEFELPAPVVRQSEGRTMVAMGTRAFEPLPFWATLPGGALAVTHDAGYAVRVLDRAGRVQRIVERPIRPRRVTREDREREIERRRRVATSGGGVAVQVGPGGTTFSGARGGMAAAGVEQMLSNIEFADVVPVISGMTADPSGRIWIQRTARIGDPGAIDLVAADGRYIGTLPAQPLPNAFSTSGLAAYIHTDELGVQRVIVRRLPEWR
jgi:hypothetical protein